jgi:hypothetical protein
VTDVPGRHWKVLLAVVSAILGVVLGRLSAMRPHTSVKPTVTPPAPPAVVEQPVEHQRRASSAVYCVLVPLLLALTVWLMSWERWVLAEIMATAAVLVLVIALRGPVQRRGRWTSGLLRALAVLAVPFDLLLLLTVIDRSVSDVGGLLLQTALFIVFVGMLAWLAASWGMAIVAEVGALLLIASMLGFVSFSGISYFTAPVSAPNLGDAAMMVFAADPDAAMSVDVEYLLGDSAVSTVVGIVVHSASPTDPRWGIILSGGIRFKPEDAWGFGIVRTDLPDGRQMLTATPGTSTGGYSGPVVGSFVASSASRSVVSLPPISLHAFKKVNLESADGFTTVTPKSLALSVSCGPLGPLETVTQATTPLAVPNQLLWRAEESLGPITYATLDQGNEDRSRNALFVVAILLGAAVACLVAAVQTLLKTAHKPA